jgi:hypothetical protein
VRAVGVIALGLTVSAVATAAPTRPAVHVADLKPFTVHGVRFHAHEHLRIVVTTRRTVVRRLEATGTGTFTLKLLHVAVRRCGQYTIRAYGPSGLRASLKSPPQSCGAQRQPI